MKPYILKYKPIGKTPLQIIEEIKKTEPSYKHSVLGFAGRLDPMAEGLLLILVDEENKKREAYEALTKTYVFSAVFGLCTDTYDRLGIIQKVLPEVTSYNIDKKLPSIVEKTLQTTKQAFPPFSSKPVQGKPLFWWARENKLHEITIPSKEISISSFSVIDFSSISSAELSETSVATIRTVHGIFRQESIITQWENFPKQYPRSLFPLVTFSITCSSGTYVREIINNMGKDLQCGAVAYTIKRTAIGPYSLEASGLSSQLEL